MALKCHFPEQHGESCDGRNPADWSIENCNPDELALAFFKGGDYEQEQLLRRWRAQMAEEIG